MLNNEDRPSPKFRVPWLLRILGSLVVLAATLWLLPSRDIWRTILDIRPSLWLFAFFVFLLGHIVAATKWWLLIAVSDDVPYTASLRAHFAGLIANLCLPGAAGGDVVRAGLISRTSRHRTGIAVSSIVDRLLDSLGLLLLSCGGALFALQGRSWSESPLLRIGILFVAGVFLVLLFAAVAARLPKRGIVGKVIEACAQFQQHPEKLALCLGLSMLVQSAFIGLNIAFAIGSGIDAPVAVWFFAWPLAKLISILPISMGGLGVREASLAGLMAGFGAIPAKVVAVGLVWQTILYASGVVGGIALFMSGKLKLARAAGDSQG